MIYHVLSVLLGAITLGLLIEYWHGRVSALSIGGAALGCALLAICGYVARGGL